MTAKSGPLKPDSDPSGPVWELSKYIIAAYLKPINVLGAPIRYDRSANRLSLHGESENAGSALKAGQFVGLIPAGATLSPAAGAMVLANNGPHLIGTGLALPVSLLALGCIIASVVMMVSFFDHLKTMTVYDHTTEPAPETDDLAQQYVDGEIESVDELEAEAEARLQ